MKHPEPAPSGWGVVIFPGSNCDHDALKAARMFSGLAPVEIWHRDAELGEFGVIFVPGGFSYGDHLRAGALARFAPAMKGVAEHAGRGGLVVGVCNGFQILAEAGLVPGVLLRNSGLRFICRDVHMRVERDDTPFTARYRIGEIISLPVAHNEGSFYAPPDQLAEIESNGQVVFRYCDPAGNVTDNANPNGSLNNIAGLVNRAGNVLGLMPHPERRVDPLLGRPDGAPLFMSINDSICRRHH